MVTIQGTDRSIAEVYWNGYRVFEPSQSPQSHARGAIIAVEHDQGIDYIYADGSVSEWARPGAAAPAWYEGIATDVLSELAEIRAAFQAAAANVRRAHAAYLQNMTPARRAAWLAEYGDGSVDEG